MHSDPELLAMMALEEPDIPADAIAHVDACPECRDELESLRRVAHLARSGSPLDDRLEQPDPSVWTRISTTLALDPAVGPSRAAVASSPDAHAALAPAPLRRMQPRPPRRRRARRWAVALSVAAAVVVGAGIAGIAIVRVNTSVPESVTTRASLTALPRWTGSRGVALVERSTGGEREVVVSLTVSHGASGYREVWLMSRDLTKLISIGVLSGTKGRFILPADVSLKAYPVVDISEEPLDGNPAHSGDSIVRGTLLGTNGTAAS